ATVFREPPAVRLEAAEGRPVVVTARGLLSAPPARLLIGAPGLPALPRAGLRAGCGDPVLGCGAPVGTDARAWARSGRRAARAPRVVRGASGEETAVLALSRTGEWSLEGVYD